MEFELQRYEINPHASKEPLTKNRTYHSFRWKTIAVITGTKAYAEEVLSKYTNVNIKYRIVARD